MASEGDLRELADKLRELNRRWRMFEVFGKSTRDNPIYYMAFEGGELYQRVVKEQSPVLTGMLRDEHLVSGVTITSSGRHGSGAMAYVDIFINPDPTLDNPAMGGAPTVYGPKYHRELRQWFQEAIEISQDPFNKLVDKHFSYKLKNWLQ